MHALDTSKFLEVDHVTNKLKTGINQFFNKCASIFYLFALQEWACVKSKDCWQRSFLFMFQWSIPEGFENSGEFYVWVSNSLSVESIIFCFEWWRYLSQFRNFFLHRKKRVCKTGYFIVSGEIYILNSIVNWLWSSTCLTGNVSGSWQSQVSLGKINKSTTWNMGK